MQAITILAKYEDKKLIPLTPFPENENEKYEAVIILIKEEGPKDYNKLLNIKPLSLGKELKPIIRSEFYEDFR